MVKLNKIYTRTGDKGTTGLATKDRVKKYDLRVRAYGAIDEANCTIGLARLHVGQHAQLSKSLERIQNDMFDLGADLATPEPDNGEKLEWEPLRIAESQVEWLESEIDRMNVDIPLLIALFCLEALILRRIFTWHAQSPGEQKHLLPNSTIKMERVLRQLPSRMQIVCPTFSS